MGKHARIQGREEWERPAENFEEMPMNRYRNPIPFCHERPERRDCCRRLEELLSCQNHLLGEILTVLEELKGNT